MHGAYAPPRMPGAQQDRSMDRGGIALPRGRDPSPYKLRGRSWRVGGPSTAAFETWGAGSAWIRSLTSLTPSPILYNLDSATHPVACMKSADALDLVTMLPLMVAERPQGDI